MPLIPRYFDLLLLLIERRGQAVHRREIFDRIWADVSVSDSALSQAVRTIRRTLDDDPREPRFIRTVSRHGYRFVFPDVIEEEEDDAAWPGAGSAPAAAVAAAADQSSERTISRGRAKRWTAASAGGALAGILAGGAGGLILAAAPGSAAPIAIAAVLAVIGGGCGAVGGGGVGAGLALAEATGRAPRTLALTAGAALGAGLAGGAIQWLARWGLAALVGLDINIGGALEGLLIGGAAGLGFAIATRQTHAGVPSPHGDERVQAMFMMALSCGLAGLALTLVGRPLVGGTIHAIADAATGSRATLAPLGRLIGEPDFGAVSRAILAFGEAATFGLGVAYGLLRAPQDGEESDSGGH